ncbi:MAG TPA: sigma-70 family RNA polymerase sigma factor [Oceanipulchritudo sp.]|nr:sigma-70 family RNA polymerase sigma factor [Oceanipulchritudo sp.]
MKQVREGDGDAFRRLFDKWKLPLVGFFYRSTGDYHRAEDLAMEVAQKVYRNREKYQPRARFSTWLFQIARNCLRDSWRRKAPVAGAGEPLHGPEWHYPQAVDAEDPQTVLEWEEWLRHALTTFPETERTALLLVVQQEMKPSEAAEVLEVTPNHLRVILNRARNRLKKIREDPL